VARLDSCSTQLPALSEAAGRALRTKVTQGFTRARDQEQLFVADFSQWATISHQTDFASKLKKKF